VSPIPLLPSSVRGRKGATGLDFPLVTKRVGPCACARDAHKVGERVDGRSCARIHLNMIASLTYRKRGHQRTIDRLAGSKRQHVVPIEMALGNESCLVV